MCSISVTNIMMVSVHVVLLYLIYMYCPLGGVAIVPVCVESSVHGVYRKTVCTHQ